ncbi:hypothetical protein [Flavobacterium ajazii]|uniref:hypothetical protein n=1 Tax=Flavobacterium ajazii TaxID=2692318 RepID=UPI0013D6C24F|nr:hypothetical protein [Flavobacterium ajazii]
MKTHIRILIYSVLFLLYLILTPFLLSLQSKLKTDFFITLSCGFAVFNIIYAFLVFRWKPLLNVLSAIAIACLALFLALKISDLHLFSQYDPYDIKTAIFANAVLSIVFWEIVYQVKKKKG